MDCCLEGVFYLEQTKKGWFACLLSYAGGSKKRLIGSVILSVISVASGLVPYYCVFRMIEAFAAGRLTVQAIGLWCGYALLALSGKGRLFRFFHYAVPLRGVSHSGGPASAGGRPFPPRTAGRGHRPFHRRDQNLVVDKIENIEPPLAHMIPEGMGHLVLPVVSIAALACIDWRVALASLITVPFSLICMMLTFRISGKNFNKYNDSNAAMNSTIVEYIEGIEVIKAFGRTGASYDKYAKSIMDYRTFVLKWLSSTWVTFKLAFALFPSTLLGTLPMCLWLGTGGAITAAEAALGVMLSMSMVTSLAKLEVFSNEIKGMQMTVEELQQYLDMPELPEPECRAELSGHGVTLKQVRFSYTGEVEGEVLHGVDLDIPQGSFTALVGPSGGGKSTVAKLISRFWDVTEGTITIGGVDVRKMPLSQLADTVSFVTPGQFPVPLLAEGEHSLGKSQSQ